MTITITGASGFVGQNLSDYLIAHQYKVQGLSLRNPSWEENVNSNANAIIHLAGKAHDTKNTSEEIEYFRINRDLTVRVFEHFLLSEIKDFFFFSSVKAAADKIEGILNEDIVPEPETPYGKSKLAAEKYLLKQVLPEGKRLFIIRPCMIHGPGNKGNLNLLYKLVKKGIPWPLAAYDNGRSFLSVDNMCFLIHEMLTHPAVPSGIYNLADDQAISTNQLIRIISDANGSKARLWRIPKAFINTMAKMGDKLHLPLNNERLQKLTENYLVSNQKIKTALSLEQLPLTAEEGLEKTIKSFG